LFCSLCCTSKNQQTYNKQIIVNNNDSKLKVIGNSNSSTDTLTFLEWKINKDTLIIVSEDDFLDYPFGCYNKLKDLSNEFKSLQYKEEFSIGVDGEKVKIHRFLNNNSYIKFYYIEGMYDGKKRYQIVSAKIYDQDILMLKNIHVGIDKSMFFSKIGSSISCKESSVKVSWCMALLQLQREYININNY